MQCIEKLSTLEDSTISLRHSFALATQSGRIRPVAPASFLWRTVFKGSLEEEHCRQAPSWKHWNVRSTPAMVSVRTVLLGGALLLALVRRLRNLGLPHLS